MRRPRLAVGVSILVLTSTVLSAQNSSVSGRVADSRGGFIGGATVTAIPLPEPGKPAMPPTPGMPSNEHTTKSNGDGTFTLEGLPAGSYALQVDADGFERSSQELVVPTTGGPIAISLTPLVLPGAETAAPAPETAAANVAELLERIRQLESRLTELEATTVLSEPETRVRRIEVYVDPSGGQHDDPVPGAQKQVTYQRERVYRRQTINEKLEEAIADAENRTVKIGVSAATVTQFANQTKGPAAEADRHAYQLASADLFFTAGLAQYTTFFADIVGLSGAPPDAEIQGLTLLNSYTARLVRQNEVNVREAWLRTELFSQRLAISAGRLDLTNYFDRNAVANDETSQFVSDALVNNPALGLATNGTGVVGVFDPRHGFTFKAGLQQSNADATNLSQSIYSLAEVGYVARPPGLGEGNYRVWFRNDNSGPAHQNATGFSADQKLTPVFGLFGRYGSSQAELGRDWFYSVGFEFQKGIVFNPDDIWGIGYAQTNLKAGDHEKLVEGYYNFLISERLRLSFHLQHQLVTPAGLDAVGFLVPAVRLQASF